jgi:hypothetical protein
MEEIPERASLRKAKIGEGAKRETVHTKTEKKVGKR